MVIKKANLNDLEKIQELNNELFDLEIKTCDDSLAKDWPFSKDGEEYFKFLILNDYVYVALENEIVIAYLAGSIVDVSYIKHQYAEVNNMCVSSSCRGKRVGTMLIDRFKTDMKELGIKELRVTASFKNEKAKSFYEKNNFVEFETTYRMEI